MATACNPVVFFGGDYDFKERPMPAPKETNCQMAPFTTQVEIERCGNVKVDTPVFTKEGELRAASRKELYAENGIRKKDCQDAVRRYGKLAVLQDMEKLAVNPVSERCTGKTAEEVKDNRELKDPFIYLFQTVKRALNLF